MKLIGLFFFRITQSLSKRGKTFFRNSKFLIAKNNLLLIFKARNRKKANVENPKINLKSSKDFSFIILFKSQKCFP